MPWQSEKICSVDHKRDWHDEVRLFQNASLGSYWRCEQVLFENAMVHFEIERYHRDRTG